MKDRTFAFRISEGDYRLLRDKAACGSVTMTDLILRSVKDKEIVVVQGLPQVLAEMKALGRNLNRLTTQCELDDMKYITGKDCCAASAYQEFMATKCSYGKADGRFFYHYTQSFSPEQAHQAALKLAEHYQGYEVLVATHCDVAHIHSHLVINSVSFADGKKLRQSPNTLKELRAISADITALDKPYQPVVYAIPEEHWIIMMRLMKQLPEIRTAWEQCRNQLQEMSSQVGRMHEQSSQRMTELEQSLLYQLQQNHISLLKRLAFWVGAGCYSWRRC